MLLVGADFAALEAMNEGEGVSDAHLTDLFAIENVPESLLERTTDDGTQKGVYRYPWACLTVVHLASPLLSSSLLWCSSGR